MEYTKYNGTDLLNGMLQAIKNNSFEEYQNSIVSDLANLELDVIDAVKGKEHTQHLFANLCRGIINKGGLVKVSLWKSDDGFQTFLAETFDLRKSGKLTLIENYKFDIL